MMRTVFLCELMEQQEIQAHAQQAHKLSSTTIYFKTTPRLQRSITASINASASAPQASSTAPRPDAGPGLLLLLPPPLLLLLLLLFLNCCLGGSGGGRGSCCSATSQPAAGRGEEGEEEDDVRRGREEVRWDELEKS
jgi:hypothetical protein